jgi:hypothetical protein
MPTPVTSRDHLSAYAPTYEDDEDLASHTEITDPPAPDSLFEGGE